ncbi:MAG: hypothetical protein P4M06_18630 [Pandoraea sp.]|nr:hypothetical protein [Pandoraea sp.]MDR3399566.1 hypothetical protein [Pandoraea sp.]
MNRKQRFRLPPPVVVGTHVISEVLRGFYAGGVFLFDRFVGLIDSGILMALRLHRRMTRGNGTGDFL